MTLEPASIEVASGERTKVVLVATNPTAADIELVFDNGCHDRITRVQYGMFDRAGNRADAVSPERSGGVLGGVGCSPSRMNVVVAPGGTARIPFALEARQETFDADFNSSRTGRVNPGSYDLVIMSDVFGEVQSKVIVR